MVMPTSVEEVQAVVRIASRHRVPLWPFSQGRNNGYGGAGVLTRGAVLVNLSKMNRVLEVDEDCAWALVEPGVRFFDLYDHLHEGDYRLWPSVPDLGWGSVIGNTLEHGLGYTVDGDHPARQCGMEVVLADGSVVRTGMGAMDGNPAWATHKRGFGPSVDGLFMQSDFGIVTKMGVLLQPAPEYFASCQVKVKNFADLAPLVETMRGLILERVVEAAHPVIATPYQSNAIDGLGIDPSQWWQGSGPMPEEDLQRMADNTGIGRWAMRFAFYGDRRVIDLSLEIVRERFAMVHGAVVTSRIFASDDIEHEAKTQPELSMSGIPSMRQLESLKAARGETFGHLDFSAVAPATGAHALRMADLLRPAFERWGIDYDPSFLLTPRGIILVTLVWFDSADEEEVSRAYDLFRELVVEARAAGCGLYRSHIEFHDHVAEQYDWGDHALRRLNSRIKDALDPAGILAPGKYGIWSGSPG